MRQARCRPVLTKLLDANPSALLLKIAALLKGMRHTPSHARKGSKRLCSSSLHYLADKPRADLQTTKAVT